MALTKSVLGVGLVLVPVLVLILVKIFLIDRYPFGKDNSSFAVVGDKTISKIEMTRVNEKLVVSEVDGKWNVNGISNVNNSVVTSFLSLLSEIQIKSPVSDDAFNELVIKKGITPVKVKVYVKNRVNRMFLVYKTNSNVYGNIMKTSGKRAKPFIVYAQGFENNIGKFFDLNELSWLPYTVFNLRPSEIKSVELVYKNDKESSFRIENRSGRYILSGQGEPGDIDSLKVLRYLSYYTYIPFEEWALEISPEEKGRITSEVPSVMIKVSTGTGQNISLSIWERWNSTEGEMLLDTDRIWGNLNESGNIFIMRYFDVDPILKKRSYFFK
jgi:hypothetical protein